MSSLLNQHSVIPFNPQVNKVHITRPKLASQITSVCKSVTGRRKGEVKETVSVPAKAKNFLAINEEQHSIVLFIVE